MLFKKIYYLMINSRSLVLLVLISFSFTLQDKNCFAYFEGCFKNKQTYKIKIKNCKEGYMNEVDENDYCTECENGYFVSKDHMRCIHISNPIEHCLYYSEYGDELCFQCEKGYGLYNDQKSCKKIENPLKNCSRSNLSSEAEKCDECENGFVLLIKIIHVKLLKIVFI